MPSKRTSDSVDRILQELNHEQTAAQVRDSVTDQQVDEILRGYHLGESSQAPAAGKRPAGGFAFAELEEDWPAPAPTPARRSAPAPAPAQPVRAPAPAPSPAPAQPRHTQQFDSLHGAMRPVAPARQNEVLADTGTLDDTTRTGIIKGFLVKMAPGSDDPDTGALNEGKNQFQKFFKDSVAVVPDENGRIRDPARKKRGIFGLKSAEDTDEFVPINVSLGSARDEESLQEPAPQPAPAPAPVEKNELLQDEYYPDRPEPAPAPRTSKKHGLFGGLFGGKSKDKMRDEDVYIPEGRAEPAPRAPQSRADSVEDTTGEIDRAPRHSKYTRPVPTPAPAGNTLTGDTLQALRSMINRPSAEQNSPEEPTLVGTNVYRKKRSTVEFVPGQQTAAPAPEPAPMPGEPVGEPVELPRSAATGFTMQMEAADVLPVDSTQDFMQAYNAVRRPTAPPAPRAVPQPAQQPVPQPADPMQPTQTLKPAAQQPAVAGPDRDAYGDTLVVPELPAPSAYLTREPDEVDRLVDTLTGKVRLNAASDPAPAPAQPTHSGFTMNLGSLQPAPATPVVPAAPQPRTRPSVAPPRPSSFVENIADAINTGGMDEPSLRPEDDYDTAAARLTASLEEESSRGSARNFGRRGARAEGERADLKHRLSKIRLGGTPADEETDLSATAPFETAELPAVAPRHEYTSAEDAPAVRRELETKLLRLRIETLVSCVLTGLVLAITLGAALAAAMPGALAEHTTLLVVVLILLLVGCGVNWKTFVGGARGFAGAPTPDSLAILPALGAVVQLAVLLAMPGSYEPTVLPLLAGPALLVLSLNSVGRLLNAGTVQGGFRLVSANVDHAVAYRLKDSGALNSIGRGLAERHISVLVSRPTQVFKNFLAAGAARGTSDKNQQQLAWLVGGCGLLGLVFNLITTRDAAQASTVLACVLGMGAPLAGTLLSAVPARLMQRSAAQVGAVVPGWRDIRQLGRINVVQVSSRDLFPAGCVSLCGIKPVRPEHIDLAIVYAASILAEASVPLRDVFVTMLGQNKNLVAKVADRETVYGKGYIGWINKRRVLVGNRSLMLDYGVKIPNEEYEQQHTVNQRRVIYLAVSGKLFAMFQLSYQRDEDTAATLDSLRRSGISLAVDAEDFNCDIPLLETAYALPSGSVKILSARDRATLEPHTAWLPESEGNMLHLGTFSSFVGGLEAAAGAAEGERKSGMVLTAGVLFSCALAILLTLTGGLAGLPLVAIVLYQAVWAVLAMAFPLIQRY